MPVSISLRIIADFCEPPVELKFTLDDNLESCIKQGVDEYRKFTDDLDVKLLTFDAFGKKALKPYKVKGYGIIFSFVLFNATYNKCALPCIPF